MNNKTRRALADSTHEELSRLGKMYGLTSGQLIRRATLMLREYVEARQNGFELMYVNPEQPKNDSVSILFPIHILKKKERTAQIWKMFKEDPNNSKYRNKLVEQYLPTVNYQATRLYFKIYKKVDVDELVSFGVLGLLDAIKSFDLDRGIKFETYCVPRVRGAMIDELRKMDWVPRSVRKKQKKIEPAKVAVEFEHGRSATDEEIAEKLCLTPDELYKLKKGANAVRQYSLHNNLYQSDTGNDLCGLDVIHDPTSQAPPQIIQKRDLMNLIVQDLDPNEESILTLYFYQGLTMKEVADNIGYSQSYVCKVLQSINSRLKDRLNGRRAEFI